MARSIKVNFFYNALLNVSKVIFPLITAPYVARVLGPDGVGLYNFSIMYVGYFVLFTLLGIPVYGVREIAKIRDDKEKRNQFVSEIISIQVLLTVAVSIFFFGSLLTISQLRSNLILFLIAGISLYTSPFVIDWYFKGIEDFRFITLRSLIIKVLSIICLFIFVKEKSDLINYVLLYSVANVANEIWNFIALYRSGLHPHFTLIGIKQHIKPLFVLFLSSIAISIYTTLDTLMLGFISDYSEVGYYNNATHITRSILMAISSLAIVAMPRISYYMKDKKMDEINSLITRSVSILAFLAFPLVAVLILVAPTFIPLFFGTDFCGSILPMQILSLLMIATGFNNLTGTQILLSLGKDNCFLYSVLTGTISNFVLNALLIPLYGAIGASIASVVAEFAVLFMTIYYIKKKTEINVVDWKDSFKSFISIAAIFVSYNISAHFAVGWWFVALFAITSTLLYLFCQLLFKNTSALLAVNTIMHRKNN